MKAALWIFAVFTPFVWAEATLEGMADRQVVEMQRQIDTSDRDFLKAVEIAHGKQ